MFWPGFLFKQGWELYSVVSWVVVSGEQAQLPCWGEMGRSAPSRLPGGMLSWLSGWEGPGTTQQQVGLLISSLAWAKQGTLQACQGFLFVVLTQADSVPQAPWPHGASGFALWTISSACCTFCLSFAGLSSF